MNWTAISNALASAILFGFSTPAAKALLGSIHPVVLAGLLYCGAGLGIALLRAARRYLRSSANAPEPALTRNDLPWLAGAVVAGGVVGPVLLLIGLTHTEASTASLLLALEGLVTALMAWFIFHESFDRRIALGMVCLVAGALVLSWSGSLGPDTLIGPLAIIGACIAWGLDNNLTRKVSLADPLQIVALKGLTAGPFTLALGLFGGGTLPALLPGLVAAIVGFLCYGVSLALYVHALRHLGTARTSAYFSTAPFFGAAVAVLALGEPVTPQLIIAGPLIALGVWLHVTERHEHDHVHELLVHSHPHFHGEGHHQHSHAADDPPGEPHTHRHVHEPLRHAHSHTPDMHHQHRH
jgi:drug/metabolite transporter (DMT)-like permease